METVSLKSDGDTLTLRIDRKARRVLAPLPLSASAFSPRGKMMRTAHGVCGKDCVVALEVGERLRAVAFCARGEAEAWLAELAAPRSGPLTEWEPSKVWREGRSARLVSHDRVEISVHPDAGLWWTVVSVNPHQMRAEDLFRDFSGTPAEAEAKAEEWARRKEIPALLAHWAPQLQPK